MNRIIFLNPFDSIFNQIKKARNPNSANVVKLIIYFFKAWGKYIDAWNKNMAIRADTTMVHNDKLPLLFL